LFGAKNKDFWWFLFDFLKVRFSWAGIAYGDPIQFEGVLEGAASAINRRLLQVVRDQHGFMAHCRAIKDYVLLAQGMLPIFLFFFIFFSR
jgi:hypothetical protein